VKASYTLGRFECTGQAPIPTSKPTNCQDLFKTGHTLNGFYNVKGISNSQIVSMYCDFSKRPNHPDYETRYGFFDIKTDPVHFFVTRNSSWSKTNTTIPFEKEYLNLGGGMNLTSGVFTAPKSGIYAFTFKGNGNLKVSNYAGYGGVFLQRNDANVAMGYSNIVGTSATSSTVSTLTVHSTLKLDMGDRIAIRHSYGAIYSTRESDIQFTGSLLEEELVIS
jgi:hypothetical protein